jgi:PTH1 family peptidyl-tRNA hydrolase
MFIAKKNKFSSSNQNIEKKEIILAVGLGNPGYKGTRHNIGAELLEKLFKDSQKNYLKSNLYSIEHEKFIIIVYTCPSLMNESGKNISYIYNKMHCKTMIVFVDDLETALGKVKISYGKGTSGHNGVKSIVHYLPHIQFYRFKIGIGRPTNQSVSEFVLDKFLSTEREILNSIDIEKQWKDLLNQIN